MIKKIILFSLLVLMLSSAYAEYQADIYFFWGDGCGYCAKEKPFLESLQSQYPQVNLKSYEVWYNSTNRDFFTQKTSEMGINAGGVPVTIIGNKHWIGYTPSHDSAIIAQIEKCISEGGCGNKYLPSEESLCLHAFLTWECSQCGIANETFQMLKEKYNIEIKVHDYPQEKELYNQFKETYGIVSAGFPIVFLGDYYLVGDNAIQTNLENLVINCLNDSCICPVDNINAYTSNPPNSGSMTFEDDFIINIPLIGQVDLSNMSLLLVTLLIGFMDGANPCSLWMITFLLGIIIYSGSRKKVAIIGLTFLVTITIVYGIFMVGLINIFYYVGFMFWIRLLVGLMALVFATVNIKDYFYYKKGLSFTISDESKPGLFKKIRKIMDPNNSIYGIIAGTILLALSVTLIELPCTAGLPMLWTSLLAKNNIAGFEFLIHLGIYLLMFLIDESAIIIIAAYTLKISKFEEKHGRILKLFGGLIMLILGISMIFMPEIMEDFANMILIFLSAAIITFLLNYVYNNFRIKKIKDLSEAQVIEVAEKEKLPMKKSAKKKAKKLNKKKSEE
ncbi:MAG: hypothetical protein PHN56_05385 [Candidatus Nanoarchaeia archaeon]|nr:hypothetical protein [Candidatus Nanoarchaeia archaeon]